MKWHPLLLSSCLLFTSVCMASVNADLDKFFNGLGFASNVTAPNVYQGQQAGYYTGGSVFARNRVHDVKIAQIDLPKFRSGCGGIDLFTGGFSILKTSELQNAMTAVIKSAGPFAFELALEEATPELANVMKHINAVASEINRLNINSCETAAGLVGSVWPKTHAAQQQVCQDIGANSGIFSDYASARQGCGSGGQMSSTLNRASGAYKNLALKNTNIAWKALQQNGFLHGDPELAELFMSLSGTVILNNPGNSDDTNQQFKVLASLAGDNQLIKALLHGDTAHMYRCDDSSPEGCLNPSVQNVTISKDKALQTRVNTLLNDIVQRIYADKALTPEEVGLLNATRLPLYKMLNVQSALAGSPSVLDIQSYADVIATDILFQYLDECLSMVKAATVSLALPENFLAQFHKNMDEARTSVRTAEQNAFHQVSMTAQLIERSQAMEQMLAGNLSSHLSGTLTWANNIREQN
ncbi:conjugal transfer protein TraH [soil metagenome]